MKKFAPIAGALLLATTSLSAASAFAAATPSVQAMVATLAGQAKSIEAAERRKGVTDDSKISAAIAANAAGLIQSFVQAGASSTNISAALAQVLASGSLSPDAAAGLGTVNSELASLEGSGPAAIGRGGQNGQGQNGGNQPPAPPPPAQAGSGYRGQDSQGNQNNQGNQG
jgi:hypothetical protein